MFNKPAAFLLLFLFLQFAARTGQAQSDSALLSLIRSFARTSSIAGREEEAVGFVRSLFPAGSLKQDRLGNLVLVLGSGSPRKLLTTSLDEPGYVVSNIRADGYLRITPLGSGQGTMFHQFLQGNEIRISTAEGPRYGVATVPSAHFDRLRLNPESKAAVHPWQETFIDVGCSSAEEVAAKGIRLLDPLTPNKKPQIIGGEAIAGYAIRAKSAVIALATVARTLMQSAFTGTVVIAFTTLDDLNGKGLEDVQNKYGPFDEVARFDKSVSLPARYVSTPVEMVQAGAVRELIDSWLKKVDRRDWNPVSLPANQSASTTSGQPASASPGWPPAVTPGWPSAPVTFTKETALLSTLVSRYGVSGAEGPVRDFILSALPKWAHPVTDEKGNILLRFGKGPQHIAFIAHMDEVGYGVDSILDDGRLVLKPRGGFFNSIWEGHAAIVHAAGSEIPAIFEPRPDYLTATMKMNGNKAPTVYAGFTSRQQALDAGIKEGVTTVTMPKQMIRLSADKATARGFDDRVGCASLLLALASIDPDKIPFTVTFVWSTGEEIGLVGSTFAAKELQDCRIVYPIDTYVSSDDPVEPRIFGYCPLGNGAVIRVLESINIVRRKDVEYLQALAARHQIRVQTGVTAGGTDGQGFLAYDIPSVPLSWPGRYSHSPIEIMDFRDLKELVALIRAIMQDGVKKYD